MRAWLLAVPVVLVGCVDGEILDPPGGGNGPAVTPLTATDVTSRSEPIVDRVVGVSLASQSVLRDSEAWSFLEELLDGLGNDSVSVPVEPPDLPPQTPPAEEEEADPAEIAAEINEWLGETVFNEDNLETSTAGSATFLLAGEDLCTGYTVCEPCPMEGPCDSNCSEQVDQDCIDVIDGIEIRIRVTSVDEDGLDVALLIGPQRVVPVTASLHPNSIASDTDLAQAKLALEHILAVVPDEDIELVPRVMQGKLRAALTISGDESFAVTWAIVQAVAVEVDTEIGTFELDVAAANPMVELVVDGVQELLAFDFDLGVVDVSLPWAVISEDENDVATALIHLAGLSFGATLSGEVDSLTVTNIGIGDGASTVKKDNVTLVQVGLNPSSGRRFDLDLAPTELYDSVLLAVAPELHLTADFELVHILGDFPEIESFLWDEIYQLRLSGAGSASVVPLPGDDDTDGGLHVATGTLEITSTAAAAPITVPAGQCLIPVEPAEGDHPILGSLAVTPCP